MLQSLEVGQAVQRVGATLVTLLSGAGLLLVSCPTPAPSDGAGIDRTAEALVESQPEATADESTTDP